MRVDRQREILPHRSGAGRSAAAILIIHATGRLLARPAGPPPDCGTPLRVRRNGLTAAGYREPSTPAGSSASGPRPGGSRRIDREPALTKVEPEFDLEHQTMSEAATNRDIGTCSRVSSRHSWQPSGTRA
jgi:hypothetical protein